MKNKKTTLLIVFIVLFLPSIKSYAGDKDTASKKHVIQDQVPFDGMDQSWMNGNDRRDSSVFHIPYFAPEIILDANATYSGNNPIDHTVVGSTALSRNNEIEVSALGFGGDFNYNGARGRFMTQFGTRSEVVPRNDYSTYRGQYDLVDAFRYLSEAYAGYHFNVMHGINVDGGLFMSYVGLNSYYQAENWDYQASYTSDNTPWFFNGIRTQIFPSNVVKIEVWLVNGWQSYASFNSNPGFGGNFTWCPNENVKLLTNDYYGQDAPGLLGRHRFHSDNSFMLRYYHHPKTKKGIIQMAFSLTGDIGFENGDGVNGFNGFKTGNDSSGYAQYFVSAMFYNRIWFDHGKLAWMFGGGVMANPGRYLVLEPSGQASDLPNPYNPTQTAGAYPFTQNPGDQFGGWDCSTNIAWMPNQSIEFKLEVLHRQANVPYFAGPGGVTSPTGYTTTMLPQGWSPDLVRSENRVIVAILFRI
ncbi:MAG TPA: outer membrane beta-barrel protein [Bacteroidia bacterium]|nr:outer membrane beta-barrel protein [Bacteroidia bacterium]